MDMLDSLQANLLSPAVLFFALGLAAAAVKSDIRMPEPVHAALTIYLLTAIGFKGGVAIAAAGIAAVWIPILAAVVLGAAIPLWVYPAARRLGRMVPADAAAIAAHYGSVSAVTFLAASTYLTSVGEPFERYSPALLAVMESPAILVGVVLGRLRDHAHNGNGAAAPKTRALIHETLFGKSIVLLLGGVLVGALTGEAGMTTMAPFFVAPFQGVLAFFLLEMGIVAGSRLSDLRRVGPFLLVFGIVGPLVNGAIGVVVGHLVGLSVGGATLLGVLAASASYIAAPAAVRLSLPEANPTLYLTSVLAITFPFNISLGIPTYLHLSRWIATRL